MLVSAAAGAIVGGAGGFAVQRAMRGVLIGDDGDGAAALPVLGFVILAVVGLACAVPMRRALRVDPATALRAE